MTTVTVTTKSDVSRSEFLSGHDAGMLSAALSELAVY